MTYPHFHTDVLPHSFCEKNETNVSFELPVEGDIVAHMKTLRLNAGEHFVLVDRAGVAHTFELAAVPRAPKKATDATVAVSVRFCGKQQYQRPARLTLVQGISTGERMDQTIRQVTELGVSRIVPLESLRSTVRLTAEARPKKQERWMRLARAAADQSAATLVPEITAPCKLDEALALVSDCDVVLVAYEEHAGTGIRAALEKCVSETLKKDKNGNAKEAFALPAPPNVPRVAIFVGSEGGFDSSEIAILQTKGAIPVSLGRSILRTETAAVIACALALHELGELGNVLEGLSPSHACPSCPNPARSNSCPNPVHINSSNLNTTSESNQSP
ncbi:MAG: 16S rRNA (uracil(1498)-N(3))-methyltransferase [Coriobacteriia bacterium]|nr:16S rRNA (uracil(1498)-N(3))-methyltransferase [Coriobacteriia bacterium]